MNKNFNYFKKEQMQQFRLLLSDKINYKLSNWETDFLNNMLKRETYTVKQQETFCKILYKKGIKPVPGYTEKEKKTLFNERKQFFKDSHKQTKESIKLGRQLMSRSSRKTKY
jgi:hypothetical protein